MERGNGGRRIEQPEPSDDDYLGRVVDVPPVPRAPVAEILDLEHLTETGNAERFVQQYGEDIRFIVEWLTWIVWRGPRWELDPASIGVQRMIKESVRRLYEAAAACDEPKLRSQIAKWAASSERRASRDSTEKLARSEPGVAISHRQLDSNPLLLNVANGTLDLAARKLRPPERQDLITRTVPVPYLADAACPRWERFLLEILPDAATVEYLQRAVGYTLTGLVVEHCLFVLWGVGANGKSTLLLVLLALLDAYATEAPADLLLARKGEAHPTEVTVLHGRRLVVAQETDDNRRWAEATVKQLTGGDRLIARRMREDFWEFSPTHKLWMATNHRPSVRGTDEGIWRRLKLIPFERVIPPESRNPRLAAELQAELPGILRWAVDGCHAWQRDGLGEPAAVTAAVAEYRTAEDRLAPFIDERCVLDPAARVSLAELRRAYEAWAQANAEGKPVDARQFKEQLRTRGCRDQNIRLAGKSVRGWTGIGLRGQEDTL